VKIGYAFLTYKGELPYTLDQPVDYRSCGQFISPQRAPDFCPRIYFQLPITGLVSAVLWHAPLGNGSFYNAAVLFPWDKFEMVDVNQDGPGGLGKRTPQCILANKNSSHEMRLALGYLTEFWQPLTSLASAGRLLPVLLKMSPEEKEDFMEKIGQSRNRAKFRVLLEKAFIALSWEVWESKEMSYPARIRDMAAHDTAIKLDRFKKLVKRMKLKRHSKE